MSRENLELIRTWASQLAGEADLAKLFRDDDMWAAASEQTAECLTADFESVRPGLPGGKTYTGASGLRRAWLDWLAPWASYRIEIKEAIDCGDRILLLVDNFGRLEGSAEEVKHATAGVYTLRDGKIRRWEIYADRADARKAVGLAD